MTAMRQQVVDCAKGYLNIPWKHMGRTRKGVDCVGLLIAVGKDLDLVPPTFAVPPYRLQPDGTMLTYFEEHCTPVLPKDIKNGTLVVFSFFGSPYHAGIVLDAKRRSIIHAFAPSKKCVVDMLDNPQSGRKFVGAWDYRGLTDG